MATPMSSPPPPNGSMESPSPNDNYISPRSKIAKMLADIDDAPTPSQPSKRPSPEQAASAAFIERESEDDPTSPIRARKSTQLRAVSPISDEEEDEDDVVVRKPLGRAARRMLGIASSTATKDSTRDNGREQQPTEYNDEDEDLYSATPLKPRSTSKNSARLERPLSMSPPGTARSGLFVSPAKDNDAQQSDDEDLPANPLQAGRNKLAELVAQKRAERLAKEAEQQKRKQKRQAQGLSSEHASSDLPDEAFENSQDAPQNPEIEQILSDAARPTRKASKKALLEMERETQRLARQQALAHQMKVKKKFSTSDLFARFNFMQPQAAALNATSSSSVSNSDATEEGVAREPVSTPPSSPPTPLDRQRAVVEHGALAKMQLVRQDTLKSLAADDDEDLPDVADILSSARQRNVVEAKTPNQPREKKGLKIARLGKKAMQPASLDDSDDDLEIIKPMPKHLRVFDQINTDRKSETHSNAIHTLRHLAHINQSDSGPRKPGYKPSIHPRVLEADLRRRAKLQAQQAQQERLAELKAKGIVVLTVEEKEREAEEFENLLEKARTEAEDLRKAEKAARKKNGEEGNMEASEDESEDEEYVGSETEDEDDGKEGGNELADDAAEDDEDEDEDMATDPEEEDVAMADAEQLDESQVDDVVPASMDKNPESTHVQPRVARLARKSHVVKDDDDDSDISQDGIAPVAPNVANDDEDPFAAFGFGAGLGGLDLMSPTQAFNATMQTPTQEIQQDSLDVLRHIAPPTSSLLPPTLPAQDSQSQADYSQSQFIPGSQVQPTQEIQLNWETQAPETPVHGAKVGTGLSETPGWEPTQDNGIPSPWPAARQGLLRQESTLDSVPAHETQSTVPLRISESPAPSNAQRRGRLMQRKPVVSDESDDEVQQPTQSKKNAFKEMQRRRMQGLNAGERAEAEKEMKRMMDEQAEESEDEYAGLGGDDTEMIAPENAEDRAMIDESHVDVDERAIAAHFAERQRIAEEEATKKLYRDITTGGLRRRQGAAWDLDEDEDDLAMRRRQLRQREEARKRRLLLQDENVKGLLESGKQSKGKDAFLRAIADDDDMDEPIDLDEPTEDSQAAQPESQSQTQEVASGPLQEVSGNKRLLEDEDDGSQEVPAPKQRRLHGADSAFSRPTSLLQVRESLSFLLEDPSQDAFAPSALDEEEDGNPDQDAESEQELASDGEDEVEAEAARQNDGGFAPNTAAMDALAMPPPRLPASQRRTTAKPAVVDRLLIKRGSSASGGSSSDGSSLGRSAWATGASSAFKAPSLLRRATTNLSAASNTNERGVSTSSDRGVTTGGAAQASGNRKSSLAYQARAEERKAIVEASSRRKAENTARIAKMRQERGAGLGGLGLGSGSGFE